MAHFYKTNKSLCTVLMVISKTTKLFKWDHPAFRNNFFLFVKLYQKLETN